MEHVGQTVTLNGWVQTSRNMNAFYFIDLRDRYGITQCIVPNPEQNEGASAENFALAGSCSRECVIRVVGTVVERSNKNKKRATGDVEIAVSELVMLNSSLTPPFKIEDKTDGLEDLRLKYRYLDIRRNPMREALMMRHKVTQLVRNFLSDQEFVEVETPVLIKSTFYALPQSPQTFKQILMVGGIDRYFQIVKCFRDEELRADRQPEFTQIDCEMSFVEQEDVLNTFEGLIRKMFADVVGHTFPPFPRMRFDDAMNFYGIDKPDMRYDMKFVDLTAIGKNKDFPVWNSAETIVGFPVRQHLKGYNKKKFKELENLAKSQMCGGTGLFWVKIDSLEDKKFTTSFGGRFYDADDIASWCAAMGAETGDALLIMAGPEGKTWKTRQALGKFRHELGTKLGLRNEGFNGLWVVDFPMLEYDEEAERWNAMHHPFTSPKPEDMKYIEDEPGKMRANAYDMVINGVEVGGGSIRIHSQELQSKIFSLLGMSKEVAQEQFGFLLGAFQYGAPPHGGLAFGLDRLCTILGGKTSIRDLMIQSPSLLTPEQMTELAIASAASEDDLKRAAHMWDAEPETKSKKMSKADKKAAKKAAKAAAKAEKNKNKPQRPNRDPRKQAEPAPAAAPAETPTE
jgi:aspartyl-tRNA synthetase